MQIKAESNEKSQTAFTLVEVMIAVLVVAVVFVTLFAGLSQGFSICNASRERLRANQIALERVEGIRLVKWSDLTNTALVPLAFTASYTPNSQTTGLTYNCTLTISPAGLSPAPSYSNDIKKVTVSVNWQSGAVMRNHTVATYVSRNGIQNYVFNN